MSRIISIGTAVPEHGTKQNAILNYMQMAYNNGVASRKLSALFNHSGIDTRYSVIPDFDDTKPKPGFFNENYSATVDERLTVFKSKAIPLALKAINKAFEKIDSSVEKFNCTHLITVSCTGMYAPGIDAELIEHLGLPNDIFRTSVNFLGCNAAFHALKIADLIVNSDSAAKVLIVSVELCTLHFQPKDNHDNLLSNTIFGDGSAAVVITSDKYAEQQKMRGMNIRGFYSLLLHKGKNLMGWNITPVNFEMILNARIPEFIGEEISDVVLKASDKYNLNPASIRKWAIHPGGKKILDTIKSTLQLNDNDVQHSYKILNEYGNMSSPTILFVLHELLEDHQPNELIFSIGFGPGISIETALLAYA